MAVLDCCRLAAILPCSARNDKSSSAGCRNRRKGETVALPKYYPLRIATEIPILRPNRQERRCGFEENECRSSMRPPLAAAYFLSIALAKETL